MSADGPGARAPEPVGPLDPVHPVEPVELAGRLGPAGPQAPAEPLEPAGPQAPAEPLDPAGPQAPAEPLDPADALQAAHLRRAKRFATGLLLVCVALFLIARLLGGTHPGWSYVGAFAEAAIIGALADWYAVVALFRHPMGVPLPHTAIIGRSQARIADSLGRFIETHFLAPEPIGARLAQIEFAGYAGRWLADPQRNGVLVDAVVRTLPRVVALLEEAGIRDALVHAALARLRRIDLAPVAAELLDTFTHQGRHHELMDAILAALHRMLADEAVVDAVRDKIRAELPKMFAMFQADRYVLRKLLASATSLLNEAQADRDHPLRREFDAFVRRFVERLRTSPDYRERIDAIKHEVLDRPEVAGFVIDVWRRFDAWLARDVESEPSVLRQHAAALAATIGARLLADVALRRAIDRTVAAIAHDLVQRHKHGATRFVAEQVRSWDVSQLTRVVELNIGTDLQYIRVNGTVVGGLIGLTIHAVMRLFGL